MQQKLRYLITLIAGTLLALFLFQANLFSQIKQDDLNKKYPETQGIYEANVPGSGKIIMQVYFKDGCLKTVEEGDAESSKFDPVAGQELQFQKVSPNKGTFLVTFLKDEQGKYTKARFVNEKAKIDLIAVKKGEIDDSKADPASPADRISYFERHYNKTEYQIPMRDGVKLFTQVYTPIDQSEKHPFIFIRTPYGVFPYGETFLNSLPSLLFEKENYIIVYQDIRGMSMSEGIFRYTAPYIADKKNNTDTDESSDAYDTVEWLLNNIPGNNGKVGVWGISYPGFLASMAAISSHPAVLAVSTQAPMSDLFVGDDGHHNGALYLAHYVNYLYSMGQPKKNPTKDFLPRLSFPTPDGYNYYLQLGTLKNITEIIFGKNNEVWNQTMAHETYDSFWKARSIYKYLQNIKPAVLNVGGWYDAEDLLGTLHTYKTIEKKNSGIQNTIVMGPWRHSRWNFMAGTNEDMGVFPISGTISYFSEKIEFPFFNYYLKGKGDLKTIPEAAVFETGTDQWRAYNTWPPAEAKEKKIYFADKGKTSFEPLPKSTETGFDEYISDPAKPVPYTMQTTAQYNGLYFVEDQRFAASRPDVLVYTSDVLTEDVTITGPITPELYVSTTGTDADWIVKVIDVYPDNTPNPKTNPANIKMGGYQRLIRGDIMRGKFRNSFEKPEPFVPGKVTKVEFELPDVQHTFLKGHKIMIQVQSSWFPLFDRNPQKFCNIRMADEKDFQKATHRIYRTSQYPSGVRFKIIAK